jgi:hypothetical protein
MTISLSEAILFLCCFGAIHFFIGYLWGDYQYEWPSWILHAEAAIAAIIAGNYVYQWLIKPLFIYIVT